MCNWTNTKNTCRRQLCNPKYSTGIWIVGAFPKYLENKSALMVALIRTRRRSGRRGRRSCKIIKRKSSFIPLSWISSTNKWLTPVKSGSWTCILPPKKQNGRRNHMSVAFFTTTIITYELPHTDLKKKTSPISYCLNFPFQKLPLQSINI